MNLVDKYNTETTLKQIKLNEPCSEGWTKLLKYLKTNNMARGILEFNLDDSADMEAYMRAVKSTKLALVIWDMDQYLRSQTKYAPDLMPVEVYNELQKTRGKLREIMSEHSIDLDELMS